jgi:imidazolonepropionase-like amidohydrolase
MVRAVEAGIDLMEHAEFLEPDGEMRFDPKIAEMMAESGIWVSPTLQTWTQYPRIVELREKRESGISRAEEEELQRLEDRAEIRLDIMRKMLEYDMQDRVVPGTDSGVNSIAFGHLDYDLRLLVEVGFTPAEALVSATRISAEAMGIEAEIGTLEQGKIADLVIFEGDPSVDIMACSKVAAIFQAGNRIT